MKTTTSRISHWMRKRPGNHRTVTRFLIPLVLACFALSRTSQAVSPAPDGCYLGFTTAEGCNALKSLTTGAGNTGLGWRSLFLDTTGNFNTGVGGGALALNNGDSNTAVGAAALLLNTSGHQNTAVGTDALVHNDDGPLNTAVGYQALFANVSGLENTAIGDQALLNNTGNFNVAVGGAALLVNTGGNDNTALGGGALNDTTGDDNTAVGFQAGILATSGSHNVYIGSGMSGVAGESNACYIASIFGQTSTNGMPVFINSNNKLGTTTSSKRFKDEVKPMDKASETIFALKPVTFRYKKDLDPEGIPQFGLVAEEVQDVNPALVVRDKEGKPYSVRYDQVNAMLLNEFLKEHKSFLEEQRKVQKLEAALAAVNQRLKEQEAKIEKVSAQTEINQPARQVARVP
jgi:trimeric autotransporter adhesin